MSLLEKLGLKESEQEQQEPKPQTKELDFKGRVREERLQLSIKVEALTKFINSTTFRNTLTRPDKLDLKSQLKYMNKYLSILDRRIERF